MPTNKLITASVVALALLVSAGCGGDGGGDDSSAKADGATTTPDRDTIALDRAQDIRACDLVTLDALSEVLDREVILDPSADNDTTCSYLTKGPKMLIFSIDAYPQRATVDEMVDESLANDVGSEKVDIGEGGYVSSQGSQVGFVKDGITYQVNLGGGGAGSYREETVAVARLIDETV